MLARDARAGGSWLQEQLAVPARLCRHTRPAAAGKGVGCGAHRGVGAGHRRARRGRGRRHGVALIVDQRAHGHGAVGHLKRVEAGGALVGLVEHGLAASTQHHHVLHSTRGGPAARDLREGRRSCKMLVPPCLVQGPSRRAAACPSGLGRSRSRRTASTDGGPPPQWCAFWRVAMPALRAPRGAPAGRWPTAAWAGRWCCTRSRQTARTRSSAGRVGRQGAAVAHGSVKGEHALLRTARRSAARAPRAAAERVAPPPRRHAPPGRLLCSGPSAGVRAAPTLGASDSAPSSGPRSHQPGPVAQVSLMEPLGLASLMSLAGAASTRSARRRRKADSGAVASLAQIWGGGGERRRGEGASGGVGRAGQRDGARARSGGRHALAPGRGAAWPISAEADLEVEGGLVHSGGALVFKREGRVRRRNSIRQPLRGAAGCAGTAAAHHC